MSSTLQTYLKHYRGFAPAVWINIIAVFIATSGMVINTFFTLFLVNDRDMSLHQLGIILASGGLGAMIGSYLSGRLCDAVNPAKIAPIGLLGFAVFEVFLPFAHQMIALLLLNFAAVTFLALFRPANFMIIFANSTIEDRTRVMAFYRVAYNLGISFGATAGGFASIDKLYTTFCFSALTSVVAALMMLKYYPLLSSKVYKKKFAPQVNPLNI